MVDTAVFSIFHRAPPPPQPPAPVEAVVAPPVPQAEPVAATPSPHVEPVPDAAISVAPAFVVEAPSSPHPVPVETAFPLPDDLVEPETVEQPVHAAPEMVGSVQPEPTPIERVADTAPPASPHLAEPLHDPIEPEPEAVAVAEMPPPAPVVEPPPDIHHEPVHAALDIIVPDQAEAEDAGGDAELELDDATDAMPSDSEPAWPGTAELVGIPVEGDQLGLANPVVITVLARLAAYPEVELDASHSGIYRPQGFRPAPWSGFAYDQADDSRTGFAAGTRILTSRGELEVERLIPGDAALTLRAPALLPISWIGRSSATSAPILIEAGALGPNLPRRPLCLAPDQAVYVEPVPTRAGHLVNGTTIRALDGAEVDLFHVDVGTAEILFAEGLPLSSSNRSRVQAAR